MAVYYHITPDPLSVYYVDHHGTQFIHAEDLYIALKKHSEPNEWLSITIDQYSFIEGVDFVLEGEGLSIEHTVFTMDMAKTLANLEQTEQGVRIRRELAALSTVPPSPELLSQDSVNQEGMSYPTQPLGENKVVVDYLDIANLIQGIRSYQHAFDEVQKSVKVEWIHSTINSIKHSTGKDFLDG